MHPDEVDVPESLVRGLLADQLPEQADRTLTPVEAWGTDHVVFRLGDTLSVRLAKIGWAAAQGEKEQRWLPVIAPHVPVEVPVPVFVGAAGRGYPFRWYVSPWLDGVNPDPETTDLVGLAEELAAVVLAIQTVGTDGAPSPLPGHRAGPLRPADEGVRWRVGQLRDETDVEGLLAVWEAGLAAAPFAGPPVWTHGDLSRGNLLLRGGRLTGLIDWGSACAGDPAADLGVAWHLFDVESRLVYRDALGFVDDDMWLRGRAWAMAQAVHALPYYRDTNPDICARSWRAVDAVLTDLGRG